MESAIEAGRTEPAFFTAALLWWFELARSQSTWEIGERRREPQSSVSWGKQTRNLSTRLPREQPHSHSCKKK